MQEGSVLRDEKAGPMNCPACGADLKGKTVCRECGRKMDKSGNTLEVEYKDFKISELLEIRSKHHESVKADMPPDSEGPAARTPLSKAHSANQAEKPGETVNPAKIVILVLLLSGLIAGFIYIVQHLFR